MDVLEFAQKYKRMCEAFKSGKDDCPAQDVPCGDISDITQELIDIVEKWSKEHSAKTRQSEFLKIYPNALTLGGILEIGPCLLNRSLYTAECQGKDCQSCCAEYWSKEVK